MSMQFSTIHNLVRTYLRVLKLDLLEPSVPLVPVAKGISGLRRLPTKPVPPA
jgi:hypothetical protein